MACARVVVVLSSGNIGPSLRSVCGLVSAWSLRVDVFSFLGDRTVVACVGILVWCWHGSILSILRIQLASGIAVGFLLAGFALCRLVFFS